MIVFTKFGITIKKIKLLKLPFVINPSPTDATVQKSQHL
jgi:hypothetical protein